MPTLRLEENLVPVLFLELHHLVLDGRAVARTDALNPPRVERGEVQVLADEVVGRRVGVTAPAGHLFHVEHAFPPFVQGKNLVSALADLLRQMGEGARWKVPVLPLA